MQARVDEAARSSAPAAVAPGQPQHMASVSRAAAQAAAAQVPNDDPYRTPSASPANMRMLAGEKHGAAVNMGPPPPYKSCKPTQRTQQHNQAAVSDASVVLLHFRVLKKSVLGELVEKSQNDPV